jgi:hypothetical protein
MDAGALGTVYHGTMQALYEPFEDKCLTVADLDGMLKDRKAVKALVRQTILKKMQTVDVTGRDLVVEEVIVEYVLRTLRHDRDLLVQSGSKGFDILCLEGRMTGTFEGFRRKLEQAPYLFVKSGTDAAETQQDMETLFEFVRTHWDEVSSTHVYHP